MPTNLTVCASTCTAGQNNGTNTLRWTPSTAGSTAFLGYDIVKYDLANGGCFHPYKFLAGQASAIFVDTGLRCTQAVFYGIRATAKPGIPGDPCPFSTTTDFVIGTPQPTGGQNQDSSFVSHPGWCP